MSIKTALASVILLSSFAACSAAPAPAVPGSAVPGSAVSAVPTVIASPAVQAVADAATSPAPPPSGSFRWTSSREVEAMAGALVAAAHEPPAAHEHTEAGARAYALTYLRRVMVAMSDPAASALDVGVAPSCRPCRGLDALARRLADRGWRVDRPIWSGVAVDGPAVEVEGARVVRVRFHQEAYRTVGPGAPSGRVPEADATMIVALTWDDGWKVADLHRTDTTVG